MIKVYVLPFVNTVFMLFHVNGHTKKNRSIWQHNVFFRQVICLASPRGQKCAVVYNPSTQQPVFFMNLHAYMQFDFVVPSRQHVSALLCNYQAMKIPYLPEYETLSLNSLHVPNIDNFVYSTVIR